MEIAELYVLAGKEIAGQLEHDASDEQKKQERMKVQKKVLDKVRKNLWTLTCQSDVVEMTGVIEDFGGEKDVETSIARAIFGLLCFGAIHGVNVPQKLEKIAGDLAAKHKGSSPTDLSKGDSTGKPAEAAAPARSASAAPPAPASIDQPPAVTETEPAHDKAGDVLPRASAGECSKEQAIQAHERSLREAKTTQEADRIWKHDITTDTRLDGKDKGALCVVYKECRKAVAVAK